MVLLCALWPLVVFPAASSCSLCRFYGRWVWPGKSRLWTDLCNSCVWVTSAWLLLSTSAGFSAGSVTPALWTKEQNMDLPWNPNPLKATNGGKKKKNMTWLNPLKAVLYPVKVTKSGGDVTSCKPLKMEVRCCNSNVSCEREQERITGRLHDSFSVMSVARQFSI